MIFGRRTEMTATLLVGATSATLLLGALAFQYGMGLPPCELCVWQRWPHGLAVLFGLGGAAALAAGLIGAPAARALAWLAILAIAVSGAIGAYHAGVEWGWWLGPTACTGAGFAPGPTSNFTPFRLVRCDEAAWRLFGLSLAGYNALISIGVAGAALYLLQRKRGLT